jgi:hypothetical protein
VRRALWSLALLAAGICLAAPAALASPRGPMGAMTPAGPPSVGPGSFGIRLVDVPDSEAADHRAWRYIVDFLHTGTVIRRRVAVQNESSRPARVLVYADAATIKNGSFIGDAGQSSSDLTTWTSVSSPELTLAPWATVMDMVTIRVPRDASAGERYGVIWAQENSAVQQSRQFAILEVSRVGVRIYLAVGSGGPPPTDFVITSIVGGRDAGGSALVDVRVRDTGQRAVDLGGDLRLTDGPGGASAGPFPLESGLTLAPGQSGLIRAVLAAATPDGPWDVTVTLQSGTTTRQAQAVIQFTTLRASAMILSRRALIAGCVLAILVVLAGWLVSRRLRSRVGYRRI